MRTDNRDALRTPDGSFLVALVAFVLIAATGLMLFLTAFVLWMYALTGSLIAGVLIAGGCCTLLAATIYGWLLRPHLCRMQEQIETVYEVARPHAAATNGCSARWLPCSAQAKGATRHDTGKRNHLPNDNRPVKNPAPPYLSSPSYRHDRSSPAREGSYLYI